MFDWGFGWGFGWGEVDFLPWGGLNQPVDVIWIDDADFGISADGRAVAQDDDGLSVGRELHAADAHRFTDHGTRRHDQSLAGEAIAYPVALSGHRPFLVEKSMAFLIGDPFPLWSAPHFEVWRASVVALFLVWGHPADHARRQAKPWFGRVAA